MIVPSRSSRSYTRLRQHNNHHGSASSLSYLSSIVFVLVITSSSSWSTTTTPACCSLAFASLSSLPPRKTASATTTLSLGQFPSGGNNHWSVLRGGGRGQQYQQSKVRLNEQSTSSTRKQDDEETLVAVDEPQQLFDDDNMDIPTITSPTDPFTSKESEDLMEEVDDIMKEVDDIMKEVSDVIQQEGIVMDGYESENEKGDVTTSITSSSSSVDTIRRGGGGSRSRVKEEESIATPDQPTLMQICKFALPCLALWVANPLLSLVDTATVGLSATEGTGATQLGALGPATTFIDGSTYLFAFLNVATTNLYASALAKARQDNPSKADTDPDYLRLEGSGVARTAIRISLGSGFALMALLLTSCVPILRLYIGASPGDTSITGPASEYIKIRALSMPTSLFYGVVQAALLGAKDSVTPLIAIMYSTVVNTLGDLYLVCYKKQGIVGAAIATTVAQWAGTLAMIRPMKLKLFPSKQFQGKQKTSSARAFFAFAAPVLTLIVGKIAAFGVLTHVAAALPPKTSLAAHQIILTLFFFISPFLEVISQTAQAFLPPFYTAKQAALTKNKPIAAYETNQAAKTLALRLLRIGLVVGSVMGIVSSSIPAFMPGLLTNDPSVQSAVKPLALPLALGALLTAPVAVSEGVLLARRDLKFLASVYLLSTALLPTALIKLVKIPKGPVINVWWGFAIFQLFRATCFTTRIWGKDMLSLFKLGGEGKED